MCAQATGERLDDKDKIIHRYSNGNLSEAGDTVTLIKELEVRGANFTAKGDTAIHNISLVQNNGEQLECRQLFVTLNASLAFCVPLRAKILRATVMTTGPSPIVLEQSTPTLEAVDLSLSLTEPVYAASLKEVQAKLLAVQQAYFHQKLRAIVVFEGWDAAGKGGTIRRLTEKLDPRGFRVHPISAPSQEEQGRHYLYRFHRRLPRPGSIAILDRSYYGRVLVEKVNGLARKQEWQRAYQEINEFERLLMDDGVRIIKLFLHIDPDEQLKRFDLRLRNPIKRWKLTEEDLRNRQQWPEYHKAINKMFRKTSTVSAPWHVVAANHKWFVRVKALQIIAATLAEGIDLSPPPLDEGLVAAAEMQLGINLEEITKN